MKKEDLKIVFFGTPDFAVESLKRIVETGYNVSAVVTATDKIAGRGHKLLSSAVKNYAVQKGLRILQPEKLKDTDFIETLKDIDADIFIIIAFRMLPEVVWRMPRLGTFNLHASLLPKYRGAAPINRAIMNGETKTGVTTFFLQHDIDTGDIIDRVEIDINDDDNAGSIHDKLMNIGAELTLSTIQSILDDSLVTTPQSQLIGEGIESCPAPKIFKETCHIDWLDTVKKIHNQVRGLSPYPGAWSILHSQSATPIEIKIFKTKIVSDSEVPDKKPGEIIIEKNRMFTVCGKGLIEILELQAAGKKRMAVEDFLRGARMVNSYFDLQ